MEIQMVIKLTYDRAKDGTLSEFREKYHRFRSHIDRLQATGTLPRGPIKVSVETKKPTPPRPEGPAPVVPFKSVFGVPLPLLVHACGHRLDTERIAV